MSEPESTSEPGKTRCGTIALAGLPNVGKSSLLNALVGEPLAIVSAKAQATRLPVVGLRTESDTQYVFTDLPGLLDPAYPLQERMRALAQEGLARAHVVLHLHPATERPAPPLGALADPGGAAVPALVVYTKGDLVEDRHAVDASALVVSARTGAGLDRLLAEVRSRLPEAPFQFPADDLGTQPVRFFAAEYLREGAFEHLDEEVPYAVAVEVEEFRENRDPVYIRATLYVERASQKQIVIGAGGRTIKAIGQHARTRIENLIGRKVFLETWVKVLPRWRRSEEQLARFGFPKSDDGGSR